MNSLTNATKTAMLLRHGGEYVIILLCDYDT